jgi:hypothetical protein
MAPGGAVTDYDDLELLKAKERGKHGRRAVLSRDSNVVDIFTEVSLGIPFGWRLEYTFMLVPFDRKSLGAIPTST